MVGKKNIASSSGWAVTNKTDLTSLWILIQNTLLLDDFLKYRRMIIVMKFEIINPYLRINSKSSSIISSRMSKYPIIKFNMFKI